MPSSPYTEFFLRILVGILVPAGSAYGALQLLELLSKIHFGSPLTWLIVLSACPLTIAARIWLRSASMRRQAAARGANIVPRVQGKWPGNLDVLLTLMNEFENDYPGTPRACIRSHAASDCCALNSGVVPRRHCAAWTHLRLPRPLARRFTHG